VHTESLAATLVLVVEQPQHAEDEPPARVGRVDAVPLQVVPRLVVGDALVHPVGLDETKERLPRQSVFPDRRLDVAHDRPGRLVREGELHLALELVEGREPVALVCVAELVHEPRVAIERAHMPAQAAREEDRADREVLAGGAGGNLGNLHG